MTKQEKDLIISIIRSGCYDSQKCEMIKTMPETSSSNLSGTWNRFTFIDTLDVNGNSYMIRKAKCSSCRAEVQLLDYDNYCPRCGSNNTFKE